MSQTLNCPKCGTRMEAAQGAGMVICSNCQELVLLSVVRKGEAKPAQAAGGAKGVPRAPAAAVAKSEKAGGKTKGEKVKSVSAKQAPKVKAKSAESSAKKKNSDDTSSGTASGVVQKVSTENIKGLLAKLDNLAMSKPMGGGKPSPGPQRPVGFSVGGEQDAVNPFVTPTSSGSTGHHQPFDPNQGLASGALPEWKPVSPVSAQGGAMPAQGGSGTIVTGPGVNAASLGPAAFGAPTTAQSDLVLQNPLEAFESLQKTTANYKSETPGFDDVVAFGNEPQTATASGGLVYDLKITGIDSDAIKASVLDCFRDNRLGISLKDAQAQIKRGELVLRELNPVRASVLVSQLKQLAVKVVWVSRQLVKATIVFFVLAFLGLGAGGTSVARAAEWGRHETNLKGYYSKIKTAEEELDKAIVAKNAVKDPAERQAAFDEVKKRYTELKKLYDDFGTEKEHVLFEHPEMGEKAERRYRHLKPKSLEEIEAGIGLNSQLFQARTKVKKAYNKHEDEPAADDAIKSLVKPSPTSSPSPTAHEGPKAHSH